MLKAPVSLVCRLPCRGGADVCREWSCGAVRVLQRERRRDVVHLPQHPVSNARISSQRNTLSKVQKILTLSGEVRICWLKCYNGTCRERLIGSHSSARFCFELSGNSNYRSGTVNSKSFVSKVLLRIKWKFELTVYFKHGMLGK